jgi:hypothetical protein
MQRDVSNMALYCTPLSLNLQVNSAAKKKKKEKVFVRRFKHVSKNC